MARPPNFPNLPCKSAALGLLFTLVTRNFITGKAPDGSLLHGHLSPGNILVKYNKREAYPKQDRIQYLIISLSPVGSWVSAQNGGDFQVSPPSYSYLRHTDYHTDNSSSNYIKITNSDVVRESETENTCRIIISRCSASCYLLNALA